ncbi:hypothetical protein SH1V18_29810 [Vallitalea longa]|uniref:HTH marR-type domain-containing protein n=1 Tax=Vallitalea longa TaxID=2936439 RepID=A0A9W5YD64_9FIRM|nr:MarR family winged helix-turn-helix transcriptional regulator [Vallitalea longa]GKX30501.1 hypothetical protein SH1V18_29810 [Vallitalea longa]
MEDKKIGFQLMISGHLIKRELDRTHEKVKLKVLGEQGNLFHTDTRIISFLARNNDKEIYQKDIEHFLSLTAPTVSNKLRTLEEKGLIKRVYSKEDTRLKQVILTEKAIDIDKRMTSEIAIFENRITRVLSEKEQDQLIHTLNKIKQEFQ